MKDKCSGEWELAEDSPFCNRGACLNFCEKFGTLK